jgi:hypothetical protein
MELEELKSIWKQNEPAFQPKGEAEIALMLKAKSISIIAKLKRSVWFELIFTIIVSIVLLKYAISLKTGAFKWTSISLLVMCMASTIYFIKKLVLLNRFNEMHENLHDTISSLIKKLNGYLKFYKTSYAILFPVYFLLGLLFGALERGTDKYLEFLQKPATIIYLVLMAGLFFFLSTWFASWFLKKLYGNHLDKLNNLLAELQSQN